jgi:hypothetical protein
MPECTVSPLLRPRNEETPAAGSESARVQPFQCSQQVTQPRHPFLGFPKPNPKTRFRSASANVRPLAYGHFLRGLNLVQMWPPHNELPVIIEGARGITPLAIPPIPPLYSQRGNSRCSLSYARRPFPRGLPYLGANLPRRDPPGRSPLSLRRGSGPPLAVAKPKNLPPPAIRARLSPKPKLRGRPPAVPGQEE